MQIKINKEIRDYNESMYFGLSLRQFIFSFLACLMAIGMYFIFIPYFSLETVSWICIISAIPFALLGFIKYNGIPLEKFIAAYIKSEFLIPKKLTVGNTNIYYLMMNEDKKEKGKDSDNIENNN